MGQLTGKMIPGQHCSCPNNILFTLTGNGWIKLPVDAAGDFGGYLAPGTYSVKVRDQVCGKWVLASPSSLVCLPTPQNLTVTAPPTCS